MAGVGLRQIGMLQCMQKCVLTAYLMCGSLFPILYNPDEQFCCNGRLYNKIQRGQNLECCSFSQGSQAPSFVYDTNNKICCQGQVLDNTININGTTIPATCCGNKVFIKNSNNDCCNGQEYDPKTGQHCIKDQVLLRKGLYACIDEAGQYNLTKEPTFGEKCCGTTLYNTSKNKCIWETVYPMSYDICGLKATAYDKKKYVCCHETGKLIPLTIQKTYTKYEVTPEYECMNDAVYDMKRKMFYFVNPSHTATPALSPLQLCRNITVYPFNPYGRELCCSSEGADGTHYLIKKKYNNVSCCGKDIYNRDESQCCDAVIIDDTKGCCGGKIYSKLQATCCGNIIVSGTNQLCCRLYPGIFIPLPKLKVNHTKCCGSSLSNIKTYNHHDQCCLLGNPTAKINCTDAGHVPKAVSSISVSAPLKSKTQNLVSTSKVTSSKAHAPKLSKLAKKTPDFMYSTATTYQTDKKLTVQNQTGKEGRNHTTDASQKDNQDCPFCKKIKGTKDCENKTEITLFVIGVTYKRSGTTIKGRLPDQRKITLQTDYRCKCFGTNTNYSLYTSKPLQETMRLTMDDVFALPITVRAIQCKIMTY